MKVSELRQALADEFGQAYSSVLASDLIMASLGGRTVNDALAAGIPPRDVWMALCRETDVPEERWYGVGRPEPKKN